MRIVWISILAAMSLVSAQEEAGVNTADALCSPDIAADSQPLFPYDPDARVDVDDIVKTRIGWVTSDCKRSLLAPKDVHWHVYTIDNGSEPRMYTSPPNLLQPQITRDGVLEFVLQDQIEFGYSKGDTLDAGVILWLRASDMEQLEIVGVDTTVELVYAAATEDMATTILTTAVDTTLRVQANARTAVRLISKGVDLTAHLDLFSGPSIAIDLAGVDAQVSVREIASANTTTSLQATLSGVDAELELLNNTGGYESIVLSGVDARVIVGTSCNGVVRKGIDAECFVDASYATERVPAVSCFVPTTKIANVQSCYGVAIDGWRGIIVILGVVGAVALCVLWRRSRHARTASNGPVDQQAVHAKTYTTTNEQNACDSLPPMAVAEVISDGAVIDPHLVTSKLDEDVKKGSDSF